MKPHTQTNEVARLRNELQGLKHAAQAVVDRWETPLWKDAEPTASVIYRLRDALAPTPEEPTIAKSATVEPAPEWRELGPDEVIHTGDQVQAKHHDRVHGVWINALPFELGSTPRDHQAYRYRTRRPLPKSENLLDREATEKQPVKSGDLNEDLNTATDLTAWMLLQEEINREVAGEIRNLRDKIEALKKNQK